MLCDQGLSESLVLSQSRDGRRETENKSMGSALHHEFRATTVRYAEPADTFKTKSDITRSDTTSVCRSLADDASDRTSASIPPRQGRRTMI